MKRIMMVILTDEEREKMALADWGCFTREANRRVGVTLARLLTEGFVMADDFSETAEFVAQQSGVSELTDTEAEGLLWDRMKAFEWGTFPLLLADWKE